ncbi:hypothetical protein LIER_35045 [Lithospermum erythrorhizon]|uniref:DUF4283 domain-containing protein n=1 Tax=Lithospermum erythrorhizon TaxID=34254 RepID=A0AAV3NJS7_LITER
MKLAFIPPEIIECKPVVRYKSIDVLPGINRWSSSAYGYVMGMNPSTGVMENFVKNQWSSFNFEEMFRLSSRIFLFKFKSDEDSDCMLASGPWMFAQRPMILKSLTPEANLEKK